MMRDWILLLHAQGNMRLLKQDIKDKTAQGKYDLTLLIETIYGSYHTVSASYYCYDTDTNSADDEVYTLQHPSYNFTLDEIERYAILKID